MIPFFDSLDSLDLTLHMALFNLVTDKNLNFAPLSTSDRQLTLWQEVTRCGGRDLLDQRLSQEASRLLETLAAIPSTKSTVLVSSSVGRWIENERFSRTYLI